MEYRILDYTLDSYEGAFGTTEANVIYIESFQGNIHDPFNWCRATFGMQGTRWYMEFSPNFHAFYFRDDDDVVHLLLKFT